MSTSDAMTAGVIGLVVAALGLRVSPPRLLLIAGIVEACFLVLIALSAGASGASSEGIFLGVAGLAFLVGAVGGARAPLWTLGTLALLVAIVPFVAGVRSGSPAVVLTVVLPPLLLAIGAWLHRPSVSSRRAS